MKRKPSKRKTAKKKPALSAKPLLELWDGPPGGPQGLLPGKNVGAVRGVPLPADFDAVIGFHAGECLLEHRYKMEFEPWIYWWLRLCHDGNEYDNGTVENGLPRYFFYSNDGIWSAPPQRIDDEGNDLSDPDGWNGENLDLTERQWFAVGVAMRDAMQEGFYLALLRYESELKAVPEAAAMLGAIRRNGKKGASVVKKIKESKRLRARRLDRDLRKTVKKKYLRVQRIATEMRCSEKTVERYLSKQK